MDAIHRSVMLKICFAAAMCCNGSSFSCCCRSCFTSSFNSTIMVGAVIIVIIRFYNKMERVTGESGVKTKMNIIYNEPVSGFKIIQEYMVTTKGMLQR